MTMTITNNFGDDDDDNDDDDHDEDGGDDCYHLECTQVAKGKSQR